jgi:hypothetical protein
MREISTHQPYALVEAVCQCFSCHKPHEKEAIGPLPPPEPEMAAQKEQGEKPVQDQEQQDQSDDHRHTLPKIISR